MTHNAPEGWTNQEWVEYTTQITGAVTLATLGLALFAIGTSWGASGIETALVETENGVAIVEGGASDGFLKGPLLGSVGMVMIVLSTHYIDKARNGGLDE